MIAPNTFSDFIAQQIILDRAEAHLKHWLSVLGLEGTQELISKYKDKPYAILYVELLKEKGIKI